MSVGIPILNHRVLKVNVGEVLVTTILRKGHITSKYMEETPLSVTYKTGNKLTE